MQSKKKKKKDCKSILKIYINFSVLSKISTMSVYGEQLVIGRKIKREKGDRYKKEEVRGRAGPGLS